MASLWLESALVSRDLRVFLDHDHLSAVPRPRHVYKWGAEPGTEMTSAGELLCPALDAVYSQLLDNFDSSTGDGQSKSDADVKGAISTLTRHRALPPSAINLWTLASAPLPLTAHTRPDRDRVRVGLAARYIADWVESETTRRIVDAERDTQCREIWTGHWAP